MKRSRLVTYLAIFAGLAQWAGPAIPQMAGTTVALARTGPNPYVPPANRIVLPREPAPDLLLNAATTAFSAKMKENRNLQSESPEKFDELLASTILPLFDFRRMTERAVAYNWRRASPQQQETLTAEFRTMLLRNYSMALANSYDRSIEYKPVHIAPGQTEVTVKSVVKQPGAEGLSIDYDMQMTAAGWKADDIKIAGISLVMNYRSSFAQSIREGGVDSLISSIAATNSQADPGPGPREQAVKPVLQMFSVLRRFFLLGDR